MRSGLTHNDIKNAEKVLYMSPDTSLKIVASFLSVSDVTLIKYSKAYGVPFGRCCRVCGGKTKGLQTFHCETEACTPQYPNKKRKPRTIKVKTCKMCTSQFVVSGVKAFCSKNCKLEDKRIKNQTVDRQKRLEYFKVYNHENKDKIKEWGVNNREKTNRRQRKARTGYENYKDIVREYGYRSWTELRFARWCKEVGVGYEYEVVKIPYIDGKGKKHNYHPDFRITRKDGTYMFIEIKGYLRNPRKMELVLEQHPHIDLRIIFVEPSNIVEGTDHTYGDWADSVGMKWSEGELMPVGWLKEII